MPRKKAALVVLSVACATGVALFLASRRSGEGAHGPRAGWVGTWSLDLPRTVDALRDTGVEPTWVEAFGRSWRGTLTIASDGTATLDLAHVGDEPKPLPYTWSHHGPGRLKLVVAPNDDFWHQNVKGWYEADALPDGSLRVVEFGG